MNLSEKLKLIEDLMYIYAGDGCQLVIRSPKFNCYKNKKYEIEIDGRICVAGNSIVECIDTMVKQQGKYFIKRQREEVEEYHIKQDKELL